LREVIKEIQLNIGNHRVKDPTEPLDGLLLFGIDTPHMGLGQILPPGGFITVGNKIITNLNEVHTLFFMLRSNNRK